MKNNNKNIFSQELVDELIRSFSDDEQQLANLSSPLASVGFTNHEDGYSEN